MQFGVLLDQTVWVLELSRALLTSLSSPGALLPVLHTPAAMRAPLGKVKDPSHVHTLHKLCPTRPYDPELQLPICTAVFPLPTFPVPGAEPDTKEAFAQ